MILCFKMMVFGYIGVCLKVVIVYVDLFNFGFVLVVGEYGFFGCLGDFVLLVYCVFVLIGEGIVFIFDGDEVDVVIGLVQVGLKFVFLCEKEGLVFINGIDGMFSQFIMVLVDFDVFVLMVDLVIVMIVQVLCGIDWVFVFDFQVLWFYLGQVILVVNIFVLLEGFDFIQVGCEGVVK